MALVGGYEDSGGGTSYPTRRTAPVTAPPMTPSVGTTPAPTPTPDPTPAPTPNPGVVAPRFNIQPVDPGKFNDPGKRDAKYDFLRAAGQYDPRQGISAGLLGDLNKLGYANFSGSGQRLSYGNVTDAGRAAGLEANGFSGDFIQNWGNGQNPNAQWAWNWSDPGGTAQAPASSAGLDPQALAALSALLGPHQTQGPDLSWLGPLLQNFMTPPAAPQAAAVPPSPEAALYQPPASVPVTQATPLAGATSGGGGGQSVQTQSVAPMAAAGVDPFTAWLRAQLGGAGAR
jgi:hypothetical protein